MEKQGGKWTAGKAGGDYAYLDFRQRLGATIKVVREAIPVKPNPLPEQTGLFGGRPLGHVGFAVKNIEDTHKGFVEILGIEAIPLGIVPRDVPDMTWPYPPGSKWNPNVKLRHVILRMGSVGIELIESLGSPTPWSDIIEKQKGTVLQHLALGRGKYEFEEWLRVGQEMGGKWTNGSIPGRGVVPNSGPFAYLDWTDSLGLVFE
jgi:hypothetical protein